MISWYNQLEKLMSGLGESFEDKVCTLSDDQLKVVFDDGFGRENGAPFTAWSENYVFFPICYDGSEWIGYAPRNPCDKSMSHQGG